MSLNTFKRKSVIQYGAKRSGKPPGGYWLPQGPFGKSTVGLQLAIDNIGPVGFSLNGPHRNIGYVGKDSKFSKNGTPYRGIHPHGWGGHLGRYAKSEPVFNVNQVIVLGDQYKYVKQSVLSTKGMLQKKYRWAYYGQYPNYWVQPVQDGTMQSDTKSQGMYLHDLSTGNDCVIDVNDSAKYSDYFKRGGPTLCQTSTARFKYNDMARNGLYTKTIKQPITAGQQILRIQRKCANPLPSQKPFPYAVNTGSGILTGGINVSSVNNSGSCNSSNRTYNAPTPEYLIQPSTIQ